MCLTLESVARSTVPSSRIRGCWMFTSIPGSKRPGCLLKKKKSVWLLAATQWSPDPVESWYPLWPTASYPLGGFDAVFSMLWGSWLPSSPSLPNRLTDHRKKAPLTCTLLGISAHVLCTLQPCSDTELWMTAVLGGDAAMLPFGEQGLTLHRPCRLQMWAWLSEGSAGPSGCRFSPWKQHSC